MTATAIEWADAVWNPVTGCRKVSAGCANCYAEGIARRFWRTQYPPTERIGGEPGTAFLVPRVFTDVRTHADRLLEPFRWRKPRRVFVNSMSDLFHEDVGDPFVRAVWDVMLAAESHTFLVLTKRPARMLDLARRLFPVARNVWLGVSAEDQATADERIPLLLQTPAAVRFVSCEPLLASIDLSGWLAMHECVGSAVTNRRALDWVIVGGESGPGARACDVDWIRRLVRQAKAAGVPAFVKQLGACRVLSGSDEGWEWFHRVTGKGSDPEEWPADLRVREFPR